MQIGATRKTFDVPYFAASRRRTLAGETTVERVALCSPCSSSSFEGAKRGPCDFSSRRHSSTKALRPHHVDIGERAAGERRKAEAEDRADIGLAHVGDDALLDTARRLERLDRRAGAA